MSAPTTTSLRAQIDHVDAAIIGLEHGIEINAARKKPDGQDGIRNLILKNWRDVRRTLVWLEANEPSVRAAIASSRGKGEE